MSKELTTVVSAEQGSVIEHAKVYYDATIAKGNEFAGYAYLCGKALLVAKEIAVDHGQFTKLKTSVFPEKALRTLDNYMNFAKAVDAKNATVAFLKDDSFLLTDRELPKTVQEQVFEAVAKSTKGKGMMETILDWKKKNAPKPAPVDAVKQEEQHQQTVEESFTTATQKLEWVLHWKDADFALASPAARKALAAICVRYGKRNKSLKPAKKGAK